MKTLTNDHIGKDVFVYFNLHRKLWSVKDVKTGLVIGHANRIELDNCQFKVSQAGRARVLREKRKNVHAGIRGKLKAFDKYYISLIVGSSVYYNPYKYDSFMSGDKKVSAANKVRLCAKNRTVYCEGLV